MQTIFRALSGLAALAVVALAGAAALHQLLVASNAAKFPPPGAFAEFESRRLHYVCRGAGAPVVIFESGLGTDSQLSWARIANELSAHTRACYYDRAGYGWSDGAPPPRSIAQIARELGAVIDAAAGDAPVILVGHSLGGPMIRAYANEHSDRVAGMVFVDSSHEEQITRLPGAADAPRPPDWRQRYGAWFGLMRWKAEENLPPLDFLDDDERARLVELSTHARYRRALLHEADAWRAGAASLPSLGYDFGDTPLIVLSQDTNYPPSDDEETKARKAVWAELQAELAGLSENSELIVVEETGHLIPIFAPKAVVEAAETMLER